ncbi:MAG: hypothetical protein ACRDMV_02335 [Streptosporangiales bacterium]
MSTPNKNKSSPRISVKVTQEIIATSIERDSSHCMIADALAKTLPNASYVSVDLATIRFTDLSAGKRYVYLTPRNAQEALLDFDQGKKPESFTLRLAGAHVLLAGNARRAKASLEPQNSSTDGVPPERRGGQAPPVGPLPGGAPRRRRKASENEGGGAGNRTGRRREFGLRAIIR